jgi:hypothetical protein
MGGPSLAEILHGHVGWSGAAIAIAAIRSETPGGTPSITPGLADAAPPGRGERLGPHGHGAPSRKPSFGTTNLTKAMGRLV